MIADIDGGLTVKVVSNELTSVSETVYNFEVEEAHNYFADDLGLWVHNQNRRKQIFRKFPRRKQAQDARPRRKPTPPGVSGKQNKRRSKCGLGNKLDKHKNNDDPKHFHDDNHNDLTKPNIHYGYNK